MACDTPNTDTMSEAAYSVLNTVELLETIFLEIDIKTLLLSQRVNKMFAATVADSSMLQQALYMKRDADADLIKKRGEELFMHRNSLIRPSKPIKTPEGYKITIVDNFKSVASYIIRFEGKLPTAELPATGSWRKMYPWNGYSKFHRHHGLRLLADDVDMKVDQLPEHLHWATVGSVLDFALEGHRFVGDIRGKPGPTDNHASEDRNLTLGPVIPMRRRDIKIRW